MNERRAGAEATVPDVLCGHARSRPEVTAAICGDVRLTWGQLADSVSRLAGALHAAGVRPGDRVLWLGQNCHRLVETLAACAEIGAIFCPVNWRQSADELIFV